ncbi:epididymal sperm-binding protein 1-like [Eublepharis macularius]|uniref:Epididymal sperm-binding protein 1-like n=1 Tax=Eublepharis macularius TaxID=481883 RepID=A0AA97K6Y4_EUBMA|nr:epididymal sperm-binding protein 1-like [Eublepharis macularius]
MAEAESTGTESHEDEVLWDGDDDGQLWCATTSSYERDRKWKACAMQEYEGNSKGSLCAFPFIYKGQKFYTCTNDNTESGRFWCGTTSNYDKHKLWSYCADTRLDSHPTGPCVFPFYYNGKSYQSCTRDGAASGKYWCSLIRNHNDDLNMFTYCKPTELVSDFGAMGFFTQLLLCASLVPFSAAFLDFSSCVFPFIYKNKTYTTCTKEDSKLNWLWCATTSSYDNDHKWKRCYEKEHGGNSHGKPCVFPFVYRKRKFYTCTDENARPRMFWCATTSNYDKDKIWSYCADTNPYFLIPTISPEEADQMKLRNIQENGYSEYEQERDQDITVQSVGSIL